MSIAVLRIITLAIMFFLPAEDDALEFLNLELEGLNDDVFFLVSCFQYAHTIFQCSVFVFCLLVVMFQYGIEPLVVAKLDEAAIDFLFTQ